MNKRSLLANSTVVVVAQVWGMLLTLGITPYVYRSLGSEGFGLFSLVLVLANYLTIVDFGFGWGIIRFVAEYAAARDFEKMEAVVRVAVWMSLALGAGLAAGLVCLAPWLVHSVFNVPEAQAHTVTIGMALAGGVAIVLLQCNVLAGVLKGLQRFDLAVGLRSLSGTVRMAGYVLVLQAGGGLLGLWIVTIVSMIVCGLAYRLCIRRLVPEISLLGKLQRSAFRTIFSFSAFSFGTRLLTMPYFYLDKLFIGALLPVAALAHYVIPFNLAQKVAGAGGLMVSVVFPSASERAHDPQALRSFYRRTVPVAYALILPIILVAITVGPRFLGYWIDEEFARLARLPLILITIGLGVVTLGSVDGTFIEAVGKPKIRTAIYTALAVVGLPLCYFLTRRFGINGTAATICLAFSVGGVLEVLAGQIVVTKDWWYVRRILTGAVALTGVGLAAGWGAGLLASGLWSAVALGVLLYLLLVLSGMRIFQTKEQFRAHLARAAGAAARVIRTMRPRAVSSCQR